MLPSPFLKSNLMGSMLKQTLNEIKNKIRTSEFLAHNITLHFSILLTKSVNILRHSKKILNILNLFMPLLNSFF